MWFLDKLRLNFFLIITSKIFFIIFLCLIFYIFYRSEILFKSEVMPTQLFSKYEHLNEEGYYKTAYAIFKFISKN